MTINLIICFLALIKEKGHRDNLILDLLNQLKNSVTDENLLNDLFMIKNNQNQRFFDISEGDQKIKVLSWLVFQQSRFKHQKNGGKFPFSRNAKIDLRPLINLNFVHILTSFSQLVLSLKSLE